jgi:hypothetical protein
MAFQRGPNIVTNGLVLALDAANTKSYPGSGTTWRDLSRNNNGTLVNGPTFNSADGGSIVFDGTNDYVGFGNNYNFELNTSFTISSWFKTTYNGTNVQNIIGKTKLQNSPADYTGYQMGMNVVTSTTGDIGKFGIALVTSPFIYPGAVMRRQTTNTYNTGNWVNATFSYNGSATRAGMLIYINGTLADVTDHDNSSTIGTLITSTNFQLGARDGTNQPFLGNIANALVYNRTLPASEVEQNYNALKGRFNL